MTNKIVTPEYMVVWDGIWEGKLVVRNIEKTAGPHSNLRSFGVKLA